MLSVRLFSYNFVFVRVEDKNLNEIRFRSDVYKMLSEPDKSVPYVLSLIPNSTISASESLKRRSLLSWVTVFTSAKTTSQ